MRARHLALAVAALLSACAGTERFDAASDIHAFLVSIRDGDAAGFDAHVDRPALKTQLRARLMAEAAIGSKAAGTRLLVAAIGRPVMDVVVDQLVQPDVFLAVAELYGYSPDAPPPGRLIIAKALKPLDAGRVCVTRSPGGACVLVFRNEDGVWRLVGFEGDPGLLKGPKGP